MRMAAAAAVFALSLAPVVAGSAAASPFDRTSDEMAAAERQIVLAEDQFEHQQFDQVVAGLSPTVDPDVFATLPEAVQYDALGLYARALYRLQAWDAAHEAFVGLTANPNATEIDWRFRADTADRIGDDEDAQIARDQAEGDDADEPEMTVA